VGVQLLPLAAFLVFWQMYCGASQQRAFYFATPVMVLETFWSDLVDGSLPTHLAVTGGEALAGFLLGNLVGAILGLSLWYFPPVANISKPYLVALGAVPVFALAPITILWFGVGMGAKVILAFLATVFVATAQAFRGAEQVDPLHLNRLRVYGATRRQIFDCLLLPSAAVWMLASLRLTIGSALLGAFIGEFIAADKGLGYMIVRAAGLFDTPRVLVGVFTIVAIALLVDRLIEAVERRALKWMPRASVSPGLSHE
jgi:NitT/TauT family transport system permease protein